MGDSVRSPLDPGIDVFLSQPYREYGPCRDVSGVHAARAKSAVRILESEAGVGKNQVADRGRVGYCLPDTEHAWPIRFFRQAPDGIVNSRYGKRGLCLYHGML